MVGARQKANRLNCPRVFGQNEDRESSQRKDYLMKNKFWALMVVIAVMCIPALVRAQTGCDDSPEDPTLVLALVASAGALITTARARFRARRNSGR
jgi:XrtJ-associated TM-motif-TM protein